MKKKILMVYPEIPNTYWSFKHTLPFVNKKAAIPPLGLMTVASLIPDNYDVRLIDMNVAPLSTGDIEEADLVFISAMIVQKRSFEYVLNLCNDIGKPTVVGGPYPTSSYKKISGVDHFILNEAETTLPEFMRDFENGVPKKYYTSEDKPDITQTPPPRFDLIDINAYINMALQYSRGCPHNCEFCDIIEMFGRKPRTKSPEQFLRELEVIYQSGFRGSVFIVDDNFVGNKKKVKELLVQIIEWQREKKYPFEFFTEASIDLARDDELLNMIRLSGFNMLFIGIETPDCETLALTQKTQNIKTDLMKSITKIQEQGIEVTAGFIVGFDSDNEDTFDRQFSFIQKAGIPLSMVGLLTALPNTQLYRRLEKENRLVSESTGNNTHDLQINFLPTMPKFKLINGYKKLLSRIYSPRLYFKRCMTLLKRYPSRKRLAAGMSFSHIRALMLSLFYQTFSRYGLYYLRFLLKTILTLPHKLPDAITLSVKGHHFFRITREIIKADEFIVKLKVTRQSFQETIADVLKKRKRDIALEMENRIVKLKYKFYKKYKSLNHDMQQYLSDALAEFDEQCEIMIHDLRQLYLYGDSVQRSYS